jgi:hypothetical protein
MEALVGAAAWSAGGTAIGSAGLFGAAGSFGAGGLITGALSSMGGGSMLSGLLTGASAFGQISAGNSSAAMMNINAQQAELNARMQMIKGREQALTISKQLDKDLASQNALFSARGVLQGEGSALAANTAAKDNAEKDLEVARFGAETGSESDKLRAAQYRAEAKMAKAAGRTEAMNTLTSNRQVMSLLGGL